MPHPLSDPMTSAPDHPLNHFLSAHAIVSMQDAATAAWHGEMTGSFSPPTVEPDATVLELHRANFELWHIEDQARAPEASDRQIAETKRAVDRTNQRRNDLAEQCDALLLAELERHGLPVAEAELHSESPGLMLDRLSILALKIYHTREEVERAGAPEGHAERCSGRSARTWRIVLTLCGRRLWRASAVSRSIGS
jgi:hypothetical protein